MTSLGFLGKNRSIVEDDHDSLQVEQNEENSLKCQIIINLFFSHCQIKIFVASLGDQGEMKQHNFLPKLVPISYEKFKQLQFFCFFCLICLFTMWNSASKKVFPQTPRSSNCQRESSADIQTP